MKSILALLIICFSFPELSGQTFNEIQIIAQEHDEPPTKDGRPVHQLTFGLNEGALTISAYKISDSLAYTSQVKIPKTLVDSLGKLIDSTPSKFKIRRKVSGKGLQEIELDLDSLNFCKAYSNQKTIAIGGITIRIIVRNGTNELLNFQFDSSQPEEFDFQKYLTLYPVIENNLLTDLPGAYLFSEFFLMEEVDEYLEIIKCEDFYYHEFISKHPEQTSMQNRTREGWNFKEYLNNRKR